MSSSSSHHCAGSDGGPHPYPGYGAGDVVAGPNIAARGAEMMVEFEKRKSCSGHRKADEVCGGKKLAQMNSFHNW